MGNCVCEREGGVLTCGKACCWDNERDEMRKRAEVTMGLGLRVHGAQEYRNRASSLRAATQLDCGSATCLGPLFNKNKESLIMVTPVPSAYKILGWIKQGRDPVSAQAAINDRRSLPFFCCSPSDPDLCIWH